MTDQSLLYPVISKQLPPCSPRGVVDMALFHLDDEQMRECLLIAPPLTVSVCSSSSATEDDSSTTVSSLDVDEENCWEEESVATQGQGRRCIFASYWKAKGGRPFRGSRGSLGVRLAKTVLDKAPRSVQGSLSPQSPQDETFDAGSYEEILEQSANSFSTRRPVEALLGDDSVASLGSSRRRLWGEKHYAQSAPSLPCVDLPGGCFRKTQSSRGINERRPSCLKTYRRYSGEITAKCPSKAASVSFSEDVQVKYVTKSDVVFAEKGWSKYFM